MYFSSEVLTYLCMLVSKEKGVAFHCLRNFSYS